MSHIALYRSWRPQRFADIVGQEPIIQTLQNALSEGRLTHAYLFNGPRGTGKTSAAKILAKAVNCEKYPAAEPCNECDACRRITEGAVMDVIELDAASNNGVDEIRDIRDKVKFAPTEVRYKVYIIDEVHMLTIGAFNALLKTLEEPPAHVIFILATTEPHKLPVTIISRCQRYDFRRISLDAQLARLEQICGAEGIEAEDKALRQIARLADGGMRDALSMLDQIIAYTGSRVTYEDVAAITGSIASEQFAQLAEAAVKGDVSAVLELAEQFIREGKSPDKCLEEGIHYYRDAIKVKLLGGSSSDPGLVRTAELYTKEQLFRAIELLNRSAGEMRYAAHPGLMLEVAFLQLSTMLSDPAAAGQASVVAESAASSAPGADRLDQLERQIRELETQLSRLSAATPEQAAAPAVPPRSRGGRPAARGSGGTLRKTALEPFIASKDSPAFQACRAKWPHVLAGVKEWSISLNAWLVNGELVSATDDAVLVAFRNSIHRETTEKPDNRQTIESVLSQVYGKPLALRTTMLGEWSKAVDAGAAQPQAEPLELVPEPENGGAHQEDWIKEAIDLFGEDMVVIKEE